ncbi:hypothetical protein V8D89_000595 [Ganoderma adspersum]
MYRYEIVARLLGEWLFLAVLVPFRLSSLRQMPPGPGREKGRHRGNLTGRIHQVHARGLASIQSGIKEYRR